MAEPRSRGRVPGKLLFAALVLLATCPLILLSLLQGVVYLRDKSFHASNRVAEAAEAIAGGVDEHLEMHRRAMVSLAAGIHLGGRFDAAALVAWLARQHAVYPGFLTLLATDRQGRIVAAYPAHGAGGRPIAAVGLSVADRGYFQRPRATGRPYISEAFRGRAFGSDAIVAISAPLAGSRGEFAGIVEGSLNLEAFRRFEQTLRHIEGMQAIILDEADKVVWASPGAGYPPLAPARELAALAQPSSAVWVTLEEERYLLASARGRVEGWTVLVRRPWGSVWSVMAWSSAFTAAGMVVAVVLSLLLVRVIMQQMSRPLRESEQRYRAVVAQSFGLICTHDRQGVLRMVNPAAAERLGYAPEELVGRNLAGLLAPAVRDRFGEYLQRLSTGRPTEGLMRVMTRAGEERIWMYRNHLVEVPGEPPYVIGHAMDVTERRRAEDLHKRHAAELARINASLQAEMAERARAEQERDRFFDVSVEMLCILGFDGCFKQLNAAWEAHLGWTPEALKSRPWLDFVHPDDREAAVIEAQRLRLGGNTVDFETRYRTRGGAYRWLSWRATSLLERGLIYAAVRDIHEQKQIEQMKSDFVSVVSHELRTPLTSIRGSLGLLAGGVAGELSEKARSLLDIAANNSERLVRLINDILDIQKIESGQMAFRFGPVELMPLVEQAVESNRPYAELYRVELQIVESVPGAKVWADADRILQVMANLLSNAARFSPQGGRVDIAVTRRHGCLRVSVTDHGKGIAPEFRSRIFQKFAQADLSPSRQKGGTGLGLSISRAIVERHGGRIGFVSEPGAATTFAFDLLEWGVGSVVETGPVGRSWPAAGARILHVEDDSDVLQVVAAVVGRNADVEPARNLAEARQRLARERFDLVILDLSLPDGSGLDLLPLLGSLSPPTPVLVFSAREVDFLIADRVASVLVKSQTSNEVLLERIRAVLASTPY